MHVPLRAIDIGLELSPCGSNPIHYRTPLKDSRVMQRIKSNQYSIQVIIKMESVGFITMDDFHFVVTPLPQNYIKVSEYDFNLNVTANHDEQGLKKSCLMPTKYFLHK